MSKIEKEDLLISLEFKMKDAAKKMNFELAAVYRDKINDLSKEPINE